MLTGTGNQLCHLESAILDSQPICAVSYIEPEHETDSGFMLFTSPLDADHSETVAICLDCLLDEHPELGQAPDVARQHGEAIRAGDGWRPMSAGRDQ